MKLVKRVTSLIERGGALLLMALLSKSVFARDLLEQALEGDIRETLGSNSKFWAIFIIIDIVLAAAMAVKTKNPMVFAGVFFIVFIPGLLIRAFVF